MQIHKGAVYWQKVQKNFILFSFWLKINLDVETSQIALVNSTYIKPDITNIKVHKNAMFPEELLNSLIMILNNTK